MLRNKKHIACAAGGTLAVALASVYILSCSFGANAEGANTEVNLVVNPVLSITATESIDLDVTPTAAGAFVSDDIAVNVITNSATGYKLYLSSNSAETALTSAAAGTSIPTVASAATSENMANNTWGYSLSGAFNPVPASSAPEMIKETSTASVSVADVTTVTVGAKVDTSTPSGVYSNTLLFTATAKDNPIANIKRNYLTRATSMQDPNIAQYCRDSYTPTTSSTIPTREFLIAENDDYIPEASLIDSRDGKSYIIRKLADGNCWMVQNLDLEGARTLTNEDTDLNGSITSFAFPASSTVGTGWASDDTTPRVIEPTGGDYITNRSTINTTGKPIEHRGNFYTWSAAVAGDISAMDQASASSICPKGWQLPNDGNETSAKSWSNLIRDVYHTYGLQGSDALYAPPINIINSGMYSVGSNSGSISMAGELAYYWTNKQVSSGIAIAYRQYGTTTVLYDPYSSYNGLSIRCVAR